MAVLPTKAVEKLQYFESHIPIWTTSASQIGTTAADVTDLSTKAQLARDKFAAQLAARQAAKAATEAFHAAIASMNTAGVGIMQQVRIQAEKTGDPAVYELAQIPAPATPEPKGPPGTPRDMIVTLDGNGALLLKWKCSNPAGATGTIYQIWRRDSPTGELNYLGGVGSKKYTDGSIPAGATQITYEIQAVRSTSKGLWATFNVNFGINTAGTTTASVTVAKAA